MKQQVNSGFNSTFQQFQDGFDCCMPWQTPLLIIAAQHWAYSAYCGWESRHEFKTVRLHILSWFWAYLVCFNACFPHSSSELVKHSIICTLGMRTKACCWACPKLYSSDKSFSSNHNGICIPVHGHTCMQILFHTWYICMYIESRATFTAPFTGWRIVNSDISCTVDWVFCTCAPALVNVCDVCVCPQPKVFAVCTTCRRKCISVL